MSLVQITMQEYNSSKPQIDDMDCRGPVAHVCITLGRSAPQSHIVSVSIMGDCVLHELLRSMNVPDHPLTVL